MPLVYLKRIEKFNATHKWWVSTSLENGNPALCGKCSNKILKSYNYTFCVTVNEQSDPTLVIFMILSKLRLCLKRLSQTSWITQTSIWI